MAGITNHDRVGKTLEYLRQGLTPYIRRELESVLGSDWLKEVLATLPGDKFSADNIKGSGDWDCAVALQVMWDFWHNVFKRNLGHMERSLVSELRSFRNKWAHQEQFSAKDALRCMDSTERLLLAISAPQAEQVSNEADRLNRERFAQETRDARKAQAELPMLEGNPAPGLKPWREVVTPHQDVASGDFQQAEFAADLWQVYNGKAKPEYNEPVEFFRRTYMTAGLKSLLSSALGRVCGKSGDPIMELQTNFGGGKTHSMLAMFHMFSGIEFAKLAGVEELTRTLKLTAKAAKVNRAVLVGTRVSPGQPWSKPDGTTVHTLWGELAWQLGGAEGYMMVAKADQTAINPGEALHHLIKQYSPCIILIDEWVAYARQLHDDGKLCGGSFEAQFTFAQALTETVKTIDHAMLVVSIPASDSASPHYQDHVSDIEIGGERGVQALHRLKNVIGRIETSWRPASEEESYAIVRRRLFNEILEPAAFKARDAVIDAFFRMYSDQASEFPKEAREPAYRARLLDCYPIHPELFERLYKDWSTLERFQRTRGVLRFMASVIHSLWERNDAALMILPSTVPIDDAKVHSEITQYLDNSWGPVIERDVDGPDAISRRLDKENPNMGRYSACRRVARTIYMASAPTSNNPHKGADALRIKIGCVQPGESAATFGDALRRLMDNAMHLYADSNRYWFDTQPTVHRLARDRAVEMKTESVIDEVKQRLRAESRSSFAGIHPCPSSSVDVPDDHSVRLVVLSPDAYHEGKSGAESRALLAAKDIIENRGNSPRQCRNTLVFLAAEHKAMQHLDEAVRQYLAWKSINDDKGEKGLNLTPQQAHQVEDRLKQADTTVRQRITEAYCILIAPTQPNAQSSEIQWPTIRLSSQDPIAERAWKKLLRDQAVYSKLAGTSLRLDLDKVPLWKGDNVPVKDLADYFARYLYLPRLSNDSVLMSAIEDGIGAMYWQKETFAYADSYDEASNRYRGLKAGSHNAGGMVDYMHGLLVCPDVAAKQIEAEKPGPTPPPGPGPVPGPGPKPPTPPPPVKKQPKRFHGSVELDPARVSRDAGKIAEEIIQHLQAQLGAKVTVNIEIQAEIPAGAPDNVVRTVTENCKTLKFNTAGFEED